MPSAARTEVPTRGAVFEPLIVLAKARVVTLVEGGVLPPGDGEFLLRALVDLESDGVGLFGPGRTADGLFYAEVADYLVARVGSLAVETGVLAPESAEAIAALEASEGGRVSELLGLSHPAPRDRGLDHAVLRLISHEGGHL